MEDELSLDGKITFGAIRREMQDQLISLSLSMSVL